MLIVGSRFGAELELFSHSLLIKTHVISSPGFLWVCVIIDIFLKTPYKNMNGSFKQKMYKYLTFLPDYLNDQNKSQIKE